MGESFLKDKIVVRRGGWSKRSGLEMESNGEKKRVWGVGAIL